MTSFLVGIIVLIAVTLAVSKSLVSERSRGSSGPGGKYRDDREELDYPEPADTAVEKKRKATDAMVDDFVLQDAVDEEERLTGVWEE